MNNGFLIAEVIFRHVFCRKTAKNGVMIVLLMRQDNILYFQLFHCRINNRKTRSVLIKMRQKKKIPKKQAAEIVILSFLIALFSGAILLMTVPSPKITLEGKPTERVDVFATYTDAGASARFLFFDISDRIVRSDTVDTSRPGRYQIRYAVSVFLKDVSAFRTVVVADRVPPVVTLLGESELRLEDIRTFTDPGATAEDNYDGDLSPAITLSHTEKAIEDGEDAGGTEYTFTYSVLDSSGNTAFATRKVVVKDRTPPVITLNGEDTVTVMLGSPYEEQGATAEDAVSGAVEVSVSGSVDTDTEGEYAVKYTAEDEAGNTAEAVRKVRVKKPLPAVSQGQPLTPGGSYVALTFDDGPSGNTTAVLDVLKQYHVKATFFILNYSESQVPLLKRIVNEGHTLAIHSYSHDYSAIYTSTDAYMNGVYTMRDKILRDTGCSVTILRFPGGSSNTVSRRYSNGVMSRLAERTAAEGYTYYDWNVDSGDADGSCMGKDYLVKNVKNGLRQERVNVVLMHDSSPKTTTPQALPEIIEYAQGKGYTFIPLSSSVPPVHHGINN